MHGRDTECRQNSAGNLSVRGWAKQRRVSCNGFDSILWAPYFFAVPIADNGWFGYCISLYMHNFLRSQLTSVPWGWRHHIPPNRRNKSGRDIPEDNPETSSWRLDSYRPEPRPVSIMVIIRFPLSLLGLLRNYPRNSSLADSDHGVFLKKLSSECKT
jgi:hypothetical protein